MVMSHLERETPKDILEYYIELLGVYSKLNITTCMGDFLESNRSEPVATAQLNWVNKVREHNAHRRSAVSIDAQINKELITEALKSLYQELLNLEEAQGIAIVIFNLLQKNSYESILDISQVIAELKALI